jgi:hypothetical protein
MCRVYDWKMNKDDREYGLRKLFDTCNKKPDVFNAGEYKYRCMRYKVGPVAEE